MELKTVLITFYKEDKLNDMKELLFANAGKLNVEGSLAMWNYYHAQTSRFLENWK